MAMVKALLCFLGTLELASREAKHKKNITGPFKSAKSQISMDMKSNLFLMFVYHNPFQNSSVYTQTARHNVCG